PRSGDHIYNEPITRTAAGRGVLEGPGTQSESRPQFRTSVCVKVGNPHSHCLPGETPDIQPRGRGIAGLGSARGPATGIGFGPRPPGAFGARAGRSKAGKTPGPAARRPAAE